MPLFDTPKPIVIAKMLKVKQELYEAQKDHPGASYTIQMDLPGIGKMSMHILPDFQKRSALLRIAYEDVRDLIQVLSKDSVTESATKLLDVAAEMIRVWGIKTFRIDWGNGKMSQVYLTRKFRTTWD